jgi:predicted lactoylglutathione lyase
MSIQFGMVVLDVTDLDLSIKFYRLLGLAVTDRLADRPVALCHFDSGVSMVLVEQFSANSDPAWVRPQTDHYQQMLEFVVDDDEAVDAEWDKLTSAGYHGRKPPNRSTGIYAALIDDPDGNVLLISSDPKARP